MPTRFILRGALPPGQKGTAQASPIRVDPTTGRLMIIPASTGAVEVAVLDAASALIQPVVSYAVDGAISPSAGVAKLSKGSIGAYTLAAPTAAQDGMLLEIDSDTAFAHVVTATGLLQNGVTGGGKNTATFAAFKGASIVLRAMSLTWVVVSASGVTVA